MTWAAITGDHFPMACETDELQQVGVLPWRIRRDGERKLLLVTARRRGQWIVPKGQPAGGSPPFVAASREAFRAAGIIGDISSCPVTTYRYRKVRADGSQVACRVAVFGMKVRGTLSHWREKAQRQRRWFSLQAAAETLADAELAAFVRALEGEPERLDCGGGADRPRLCLSGLPAPESLR